ncbi:MAG: flagellar hook-basal body complex protein [Terracidiphilus sp.]
MASFSIPLTGLNADSTALNTIANNLSNMNTTGFKAKSVNFSDLFYQQVGTAGSGDPIQVGAGTKVGSIETDFSNGSPNSTGVDTDVALQGSGFFVVSDGATQFLTRAGNFTTDSNGNLITANGLKVMGYPGVNGVVNTNAALAPINIPEGQVEAPSATASFGMTAVLNSSAPAGSSISGPAPVFDSLGNQYAATVTYTKTGTNAWSYNITLPDTLTPAAATPANVKYAATPTMTTKLPNDIYTYDFASSNGALATVDGTATLTINGTTIGIPPAGELVSTLEGQINTAFPGSAGLNNGVLTVTVPTGTPVVNGIVQSMAGSTLSYNFGTNSGQTATVDPTTNISITGQKADLSTATIIVPAVAPGEDIGTYAASLTTALNNAGIVGVTVQGSVATGSLTITGANMSTTGSVTQEPVAAASANGTLKFDADGNLISPGTNLSGITFAGLSDGAAPLNLTWDLFGANGKGNITQVAAATSAANTAGSVSNYTGDGFASGTYSGFTIGSDGTVTATFSNMQNLKVGQLALGQVANLQGLNDLGNGDFQATLNSGTMSIGTSGTAGLGTMQGGALESSNVNISAEFSDLIVAQRAFEANSKTITTFDTVTQETINMIH